MSPSRLTINLFGVGAPAVRSAGGQVGLSDQRLEDRLLAFICLHDCLPDCWFGDKCAMWAELSYPSVLEGLGFKSKEQAHRAAFELGVALRGGEASRPKVPKGEQLDSLVTVVHNANLDLREFLLRLGGGSEQLREATKIYKQPFIHGWKGERWADEARQEVDRRFWGAWNSFEFGRRELRTTVEGLLGSLLDLVRPDDGPRVLKVKEIIHRLAQQLERDRNFTFARILCDGFLSRTRTLGLDRDTDSEILLGRIKTTENEFELSDAAGYVPAPPMKGLVRKNELDTIVNALRGGPERVVTLTGLRGTGKSWLAQEAAHAVREEFFDRCWHIPLDQLRQGRGVAGFVASKLGIRRRNTDPSTVPALRRFFRRKEILIVLDNCESAPVETAEIVGELLACSEGIRFLATSRYPLGIIGERIIKIRGLEFPSQVTALNPASIREYPAVQLFLMSLKEPHALVWNAQNAHTVAQVVAILDGNLWAMITVASWYPHQPLDKILASLKASSGGPIQMVLRAAIDPLGWKSRTLLLRLWVFSGGWDAEAAECVCGFDPLDPSDVPFAEKDLFERNLVERMPGQRFRLLPVVRDYLEHTLLTATEQELLRRRLGKYLVRVSRELGQGAIARAPMESAARLRNELGNFNSTFEWCTSSEHELGLEIVGNLWPCWIIDCSLAEGVDKIREFLGKRESETDRQRARACLGASVLGFYQADFRECLERGEEGMVLCRRAKDAWGLAVSLVMVGIGRFHLRQEFEAARDCFHESVQVATQEGDTWILALTLSNQALHLVFLPGESQPAVRRLLEADVEKVLESLERSRKLAEDNGSQWLRSLVHLNIGACLLYLYGEAHLSGVTNEFRAALLIHNEIGNKYGVIQIVGKLAAVALFQARPRRAAKLLGGQAKLVGDDKIPKPEIDAVESARTEQQVREGLGMEVFEQLWAEGREMMKDQIVTYALADSD